MVRLFENTKINSLIIKNRFVRSATWEGMATSDGACSRDLSDLMLRLASGKIGLIITGHTFVCRVGQAGPRQMGIYSDHLISGFKAMTDAVHAAGGTIIMQLAHAGHRAETGITRLEAMGPSNWRNANGVIGREMTLHDIKATAESFGQGAVRAQKAGFDGVQIHAAHGYLLSQFLSPIHNKRGDKYGGSLNNRARFVLEVFERVRLCVGDDFPVIIKLNSQDTAEGGFSVDDMLQVAAMLQQAGIDAIELSGALHQMANTPSNTKEVYYYQQAMRYKQKIDVPLILVGGIRSFNTAVSLVSGGLADYISLSRPFIREPELIGRWKSGDTRDALCVRDNLCFMSALKGKGLQCVFKR